MDGMLAAAVRHRWAPIKLVVVSGHVTGDSELPPGMGQRNLNQKKWSVVVNIDQRPISTWRKSTRQEASKAVFIGKPGGAAMAHYDPETLILLRKVLEEAWAALPEGSKSDTVKSELANTF
jgi:hypothetical protein